MTQIKGYTVNSITSKELENLDKAENFLERHKLLKQTKEAVEDLNRMTGKEIELVIKNPQRNFFYLGLDTFSSELC